jgi:hypothetical protein
MREWSLRASPSHSLLRRLSYSFSQPSCSPGGGAVSLKRKCLLGSFRLGAEADSRGKPAGQILALSTAVTSLSVVSKDVRVVCDFCRNKYYERERLCVLINADHLSKGSRICVNCLPELGITGCTDVSGHGFEYDRLGTDEPPEGWEYDRPSWREQIGALSGEWPRDPYERPSGMTGLDISAAA